MTDVYGTHQDVGSEPSRDDLTEIKGIGTTTAEKLYNAKIVTIRQITEMTPERLAETPGIGLTTATKFITAAKSLLECAREEVIASETTQVQNAEIVESEPTPVENYEVQETIVEEIEEIGEESLIEPERECDQFQPEQTRQLIVVEEEEFDIGPEFEYEQSEQIELVKAKIDAQPEIEQLSECEEASKIEAVPEPQIERNQLELQEDIDIRFIRGGPRKISEIFRDAGCHEIPSTLRSLKQFTTPLDYLGYKVVEASDDLKILFLFPVKRFDQEGTVLIDESKIKLNSRSENIDRGACVDIKQITRNLLRVRDSIVEDVANDQRIVRFFQKYSHITLSLEKGFGPKSLVFFSGTTQYKIIIEPILLCFNPPRSMEKSLAFPYQKSTNLHAVSRTDLGALIRFLEKKYQMVVSSDQGFKVKNYAQTEETLRSSVKYASIPILGFSITLLVVYFAELYFLLRLFNTVGFAVVGIYFSLLAFFYCKAYKTKKRFTDQFEIPYYLQTLEFSEIDLLDFREELTDKLLTQFGYECLKKNAKFGVIERSEANALKHTVEIKRTEPEFKNMFEPDQVKNEIVGKISTAYGTKYSSFLEDG